jgi:hypothetical protein
MRRLEVAGSAVIGLIAGAVALAPTYESVSLAAAPARVILPVARRETRPTLSPSRFGGEAAMAYQVAREIPGVLDQLTCYCACGTEYGHVSLLSCYADGHAAT